MPNDPTPIGLCRSALDFALFSTLKLKQRAQLLGHNPVGVDDKAVLFPGLLMLATLGWRTKSRWDFRLS